MAGGKLYPVNPIPLKQVLSWIKLSQTTIPMCWKWTKANHNLGIYL